jgi:hypothetical protein
MSVLLCNIFFDFNEVCFNEVCSVARLRCRGTSYKNMLASAVRNPRLEKKKKKIYIVKKQYIKLFHCILSVDALLEAQCGDVISLPYTCFVV